MENTLIRQEFSDASTIGEWFIEDKHFCWTLEDVDKQRQADGSIIPWKPELKVPKETAIPYGKYEIITNFSTRFGRVMPLLLHVESFDGVRIHVGNDRGDTEGCILMGELKTVDMVCQSAMVFNRFFSMLKLWLEEGRVYVTIIPKKAS